MTLLFGVCGWDYRDWAGPLYPRPLPAGYRPLPLLARFLDFMEVNATFYRPMGGRVSVRWLEETPDTFRFVLKAWRGWTHDGEPPEGEELARFRELLDPILDRGRLEGVLAQYPPSFRDSAQGRRSITGLRDALRPAPLFVEVRHRGLYTEEFLSFLEGEDIAFVNVDLPAVGSLPRLTRINTGPRAYLRLHGRNLRGWSDPRAARDDRYSHTYTGGEIAELVAVVKALLSRAPTVLVGANNHFAAQAPAAAVLLRSACHGRPVAAPSALLRAFPDLEGRARPLEAEGSPPGKG